MRNAQRATQRANMISQYAQYNAYEMGIDSNFLDGYQLVTEIAFVSIHKGTQFQKLLNRTDIPCMIWNTTPLLTLAIII